MSKTIEYKIKVDAGSSVKTLGQLEQELAGINQELKEVQVGSDKFNELTKSAQSATKEISKISNQIQGITGEDKIRGVDGAIKTLAGSVQATVGALGLLGIESDKFGEFQEKAASAIAFGIGLKDVGEGVRNLGGFISKLPGPTKIATLAQKAFNLALRANPIGAVVTAIGLVVAGLLLFSDKARSLIKSIEPLNNILQKTVGFLKSVGQAIGLVASEEEIAAKKLKEATDQRVKQIDRELKERKAAGEETVELEREKLKKLIELTEEGTEERKDAESDLAAFEKGLNRERIKDDEDKNDKIVEQNKKRADELAKIAEDIFNRSKTFEEKLEDILDRTDQQKLDREQERARKEIQLIEATDIEKRRLLEVANAFFAQKQEEKTKKFKEELFKRIEEEIKAEAKLENEIEQLRIDSILNRKKQLEEQLKFNLSLIDQELTAELAALKTRFDDKKIGEENLDEQGSLLRQKAIALREKENEENKLDLDDLANYERFITAETSAFKLNVATNTAFAIADLLNVIAGENKTVATAGVVIEQAGAIAGIVANTALGNAKIIAQLGIASPPFVLLNKIGAAASIVATLASARKAIQQINNPSSSVGSFSGGGIGGPSLPTTAPNAPATPTTQTPLATQIEAGDAIQQNGQEQVIQAFVLEGNVSSAQEAARKIRQRRTIGR